MPSAGGGMVWLEKGPVAGAQAKVDRDDLHTGRRDEPNPANDRHCEQFVTLGLWKGSDVGRPEWSRPVRLCPAGAHGAVGPDAEGASTALGPSLPDPTLSLPSRVEPGSVAP